MAYVQGYGNQRPKLMIIGDSPGKADEYTGVPFSGSRGKVLERALRTGNTQREEVYSTYLCKYPIPQGDWSRLAEAGTSLSKCKESLYDEIKTFKPNCILALGEKPLEVLTGNKKIGLYRGSILRDTTGVYKIVASLSPSNFIQEKDGERNVLKYQWRYVFEADVRRAIAQSLFPEIKRPQRNLEVCRSSLQLYKFIERNVNRGFPSVDIEASGCVPTCCALSFHQSEAISIPLWNRVNGGFEFSQIGDYELAQIWKELYDVLATYKVGGQNFKFDQDKMYRLGFRFKGLYADSMLLGHTLNPEFPNLKLEFFTSIFTEEPYYKDEGKEFNPKKDNIDRLYLYNAKDAAVTNEVIEAMFADVRELGEAHGIPLEEFYKGYVNELHQFYLDMENVGILTNEEVRKRLIEKYESRLKDRQTVLNSRVGFDFNVSSPQQCANVVFGQLKLPKRTSRKSGNVTTDESTLVALLANNVKTEIQRETLNDIIDIRKIRKNISTYLEAPCDYDGRMRTSYFIVGTETGRTSTGILEPPIRPDSMGLAFQTITKHGEMSDMREMFYPDKGYVFLGVDLSQADARVVAVLSTNYELLHKVDNVKGYDMHWEVAEWVYGSISAEEKANKDDPRRFIGKKGRHATNYDMQKRRFMMEANKEAKKAGVNLTISEWKAGQILDAIHKNEPKLRQVFHKEIKAIIDESRTLINPFGRIRQFFGRFESDYEKEEVYRVAYSFIPQSTVADRLKTAGLAVKREYPDLRFIIESHDAFTVLCPVNEIERVARLFKKYLEQPIDFRKYCSIKRDYDLVIKADFEVSDTDLKHMTKYKLAS